MKKRGFTLIELIVAMVMAVLLLGALVPLMTLSQKSNYDGQRQTRVNQAGEAIYEYVAGQMRAANRVFVGYGAPGGTDALYPDDWETWNRITVDENGQLAVNGAAIYPADYQQACTLQLEARGRDRTVLDLSVRLADARGEGNKGLLYEKESAVTLQNLTLDAFAQAEGLAGVSLSAGTAGDTEATAEAYGPLVLYYKADDMTISPFPTPGGDVDPGGPGGGPAAGSFNVFLSPTQVTLKVDASQKVQATVTKPAGWGEPTYTWAWADDAYAAVAQNGAAATVTGKKPTGDEAKTLSLTVRVRDGEGLVHEKTVTATVRVVEEKPDEPTGEFILVTKKNQSTPDWSYGDDDNRDVNKQTLYWDVNDLPQGFSLLGLKNQYGGQMLTGTWSVNSDAAQAFQDACKTPDNKNAFYCYRGKPATGVVTFTFTSDGGSIGSADALKELKGQWATVTIVFYDASKIETALVFSETKQTTFTDNYTDDMAVGTEAASALLTLRAADRETRAVLAELLGTATVTLRTADYSGWPADPLLQRPAASVLPVPDTMGSCSVQMTMRYARTMRPVSTTNLSEVFQPITAEITTSTGLTFTTNTIIFTAQKNVPAFTKDVKLYFSEYEITEETVDYFERNLYMPAETAVAYFNFGTGTKAQEAAAYYAGYSVRLTSGSWSETAGEPLIQQPVKDVVLGQPQQNDKGQWLLTARFPLVLNRAPTGKSEKIKFTAYALVEPDQKSNEITLTLQMPTSGIVLRRGWGDAQGEVVNGKTVLVGRNTKNLLFTAYPDETSSTPRQGYWRSTMVWLVWDNGVSDKETTGIGIYRNSPYYTDKQNSEGGREAGWAGDTVTIRYGDWPWRGFEELARVYVKLVDVDEIKTELRIDDATDDKQHKITVPAGVNVPLTLDTCYAKDADYTVEWKVSHSSLFQTPETEYLQGKGDGAEDKTSLVLRAAAGAAVEKDTAVMVIATWKDADGNVIGTDEAEITVTKPKPLKLYVWVPDAGYEEEPEDFEHGRYEEVTGTIQREVGQVLHLAAYRGDYAMLGSWTSSNTACAPDGAEGYRYVQVLGPEAAGQTAVLTFRESAGLYGTDEVEVTVRPVIDPVEPPSGDLPSNKDDADVVDTLHAGKRAVTIEYDEAIGKIPQARKYWYHWNGTDWDLEAEFQGNGGSETATHAAGALQVVYKPEAVGFTWLKEPDGPVTERFQLVVYDKDGTQVRASQIIKITVK